MELKVEVEVDRMPRNSVSNPLLNPREDKLCPGFAFESPLKHRKVRLGFCLGYQYKEESEGKACGVAY